MHFVCTSTYKLVTSLCYFYYETSSKDNSVTKIDLAAKHRLTNRTVHPPNLSWSTGNWNILALSKFTAQLDY